MHPNKIFRGAEAAQNIAFARKRAFGTLSMNAQDGPLLAHVPFLLSETGAVAELHLVRSNPIARALAAPEKAVISVSGPDGYISPDWYELPDMVPTWNYIAVHLRGRLEMMPQDDLHDLLERQAADYEARITEKAPWTFDKVSPDAIRRLERMIVPVKLHIEAIDGTWKLGQNREDSARLRAAKAMQDGFGQELAEISALMTDPPA